MSKFCRLALIILAVTLVFSGVSSAQAWRGMGRMAGKVTDEGGAPIEGVTVKVYQPEAKGGTEVKTNKRGEWVIGGIARGGWQVDFLKNGYEPRQITVEVDELNSNPPIALSLKKVAPQADPNVELRDDLERAAGLMNQKKYAEARAVYQTLLEKYPQAHQLHPLIARTYYGENQFEKSIEHLRIALEKDPDNVEVRLLLGNILVERGNAEEGKQLLATIDDSKVKDPTTFLNVGIVLLNQNKPAEAQTYFEKTIKLFPTYPDAYYYRALAHLQTGNTDAAKADLRKFLEMAPNAPEAATATKILEQLK
ncbi:MAG: tetratricopeptide repeat protein [Acidobacteria bacterium]|nr:tetratricopeptide repeat protein [Acidobacteriota bacterium]